MCFHLIYFSIPSLRRLQINNVQNGKMNPLEKYWNIFYNKYSWILLSVSYKGRTGQSIDTIFPISCIFKNLRIGSNLVLFEGPTNFKVFVKRSCENFHSEQFYNWFLRAHTKVTIFISIYEQNACVFSWSRNFMVLQSSRVYLSNNTKFIRKVTHVTYPHNLRSDGGEKYTKWKPKTKWFYHRKFNLIS